MRFNRSTPSSLRRAWALAGALALLCGLFLRFHFSRPLTSVGRTDSSRTSRSPASADARSPASSGVPCDFPTPGTPFAALVEQRQRRDTSLARIQAFNLWLAEWRRAEPSSPSTPSPLAALAARGRELAAGRREAMAFLIATDPRRALGAAVPDSLRAQLPAPIQALLEQRIDAHGDLEVIAGGSGSETRIDRWALIGERRYRAYVFGRRESQATKHQLPLHGIAIDSALALDEAPFRLLDDGEKSDLGLAPPALAARVGAQRQVLPDAAALAALRTGLEAAESLPGPVVRPPSSLPPRLSEATSTTSLTTTSGPVAATASDWVLGRKRVLYICVDFPDATGAAAANSAIVTSVNTANQFYQDVSNGRCSLDLAIFPTVLRMPRAKTFYEANPDSYIEISDEARSQARAYDTSHGTGGLTNPDLYDRWIVLYPTLKNHNYGGRGSIGGAGVWLNGSLSIVAHELGHNHGLPHAHAWQVPGSSPLDPAGQHVEYGDIYDVMGSAAAPNGFFNTVLRHYLGYLDATTTAAITQPGTYRLYRHDDRNATGVQALQIVSGGGYDYWLEHRRLLPTNDTLNAAQTAALQGGVLIHWGRYPSFAPGPGSYLLDMNPDRLGDMHDAALGPGRTFTDPTAALSITPVAAGGVAPHDYVDVQIAYGATGSNHNPVLAAVAPPPGASQARTDITFSASATDPDGDPVYYRWDFGDDKSAVSSVAVTHRWLLGGTYTITVSALDGRGGIATRSFPLTVSDPLLAWTPRAAGLVSDAFFDVLYAGNQFLAVGNNGAVCLSPDGVSWGRANRAIAAHSYRAVAYGNSRYVAVGTQYPANTGVFAAAASADGNVWQATGLPAGPGLLYGVAYGAGRFVAVGDAGKIYASADGAAWQECASGITSTLLTVRFANGRFVAAGASGHILSSGDGIQWTNTTPPLATGYFAGAAYAGGKWIVSSGYEAWTSPDSLTWTHAPNPDVDGIRNLGVAFGLVMGFPYSGAISFTADDVTWSRVLPGGYTPKGFTAVTEGNGTAIAVGFDGVIYQAGTPRLVAPRVANAAALAAVSVGHATPVALDAPGLSHLELLVNGQPTANPGVSTALNFIPAAFGTYSLAVRGVSATGETITSAPVNAKATLSDWRQCNPAPFSVDLNDAVRVGRQWWIVGNAGLLATLEDDGRATLQPVPIAGNLHAIAYGNSRFVIAADGYNSVTPAAQAALWSSPDGVTWTPAANTTFAYAYGLAFGGNQWVAVGLNGWIATSPDGVTWTIRTSGTNFQLRQVAHNGRLWVAVGDSGTILTSPDAITWTAAASGTTQTLSGVAYAAGRFVAVGSVGAIATSSDGAEWTVTRYVNPVQLFAVRAVQGAFIAVGAAGVIIKSPDGLTWTSTFIPPNRGGLPEIGYLLNVGQDGTDALLVGRYGECLTPTASSWVHRDTGVVDALRGVIYAGSRFVAVSQGFDASHSGSTSPIQTSPDGVTWTKGTSTDNTFTDLSAVAYGQSLYVAAGTAGRLYTSPDAATWTGRSSGTTANLTALASGPALLVAAGDRGVITTSPDGLAWTARVSGLPGNLLSAAYGNGTFVLVGDNGAILTSRDGLSWSARTSGTTKQLQTVAWAGEAGFLAGGVSATLLQSPDGITWTARTVGSFETVTAVGVTPFGPVAALNSGVMAFSADGVSWIRTQSAGDRPIKSIAASPTTLVAVGDSGEILSHSLFVETVPPQVIAGPVAQANAAGATVSFDVTADGAATYQWTRDGVPIAGATTSSLTLRNLQAGDHGAQIAVIVANVSGSVTTTPVTLTVISARLANLSVRSLTTADDQALTVGFSIVGTYGKTILLRAVGPGLGQFGVSGAVSDPRLTLFSGTRGIGQNDNWGGGTALASMFTTVGAFGLPATSKDAAFTMPLAPGSYTARATASTGTGIVLLEGYDADSGPTADRFVNLSARNFAGPGDSVLVIGFSIAGNAPLKLLIRAVGPTLSQFGVGGVLANPTLQLFQGTTPLQANDDWGGGAALAATFQSVGAFALPATSKDSALLVTLAPGSYTAQVTGVAGTTGVALVEVYEVP